ncbi:MAG: DUF2934 domain-containing protein [Myxococcales bacterium]|nr:DUF2934 domain-containing protein [Myxococcales bacterium]
MARPIQIRSTPERFGEPYARPEEGPTHEEIARRAYELWQARGRTHGRQEEDWLQAERELGMRRR